jgi:DNA polymerase-4
MDRHIAHLAIPDFYGALEEARHPELRGRPLALAEPGGRAVIQGVNAGARREGIHAGMPLAQARRSCRRLQVLAPDLRFYRRCSKHILEGLGRFSPLVEGTLWGHYFVDLTGTERLWGPSRDSACRLERELATREGMHACVGLAANKLVSQVAARCVPPGDLCDIFPGGEPAFLAPLPLTFLPGVGTVTVSRLVDLNIQRVGELAGIPRGLLVSVFGRAASRLLRLARGIDPAPVVPFRDAPRLSLVRDLDREEIRSAKLSAILWQLVEEAGWVLRRHQRYPGEFSLEMRYADGVTAHHREPLAPAIPPLDRPLFQAVGPALVRLTRRRVAVRRLVLEFSQFISPLRQMSLFPWEEVAVERESKLQQALDGMRRRFGRRAISWGRAAP